MASTIVPGASSDIASVCRVCCGDMARVLASFARRRALDALERWTASRAIAARGRSDVASDGGATTTTREGDGDEASVEGAVGGKGAVSVGDGRARREYVPRYRREGFAAAEARPRARRESRARGSEGATTAFAYGGERASRNLSPELNSEITGARTGEEILEHIRTRCHLYNRVNCATAWHRLAKSARQRSLPRGWNASQDTRIMDLEETTLRLLETFEVQNLSNFVWACAVLKYSPRHDLLSLAMDSMEAKVDEFYPQALTNTLWAVAVMKHPRAKHLAALLAPQILTHLPEPDQELQQVESVKGGIFSTQTVSNALWTLASMGVHPGYELLDRLAIFITKGAETFKAQELSNSVWAYGQFAHHPGEAALCAFEQSLRERLERREEFATQALSNSCIGLSLFGGSESGGLCRLFNEANPSLFRLSEGNSQDISNITWSIAAGGAFESKLYKAAVRELFRRDAKDFQHEGLKMLYHARLMQHDFDPDRKLVDVVFPDYVSELGHRAWLEQNKKTQVSTFQERVIETVRKLGYEPTMEQMTEDGLMSIDICIREKHIAIECDGPSHFYTNLTETTNHKTMLRNKALALRGWKVVAVPYYEWALEWSSGDAAVKAYMERRLREVE